MLRICKNDTGFHYTAENDAERIKEARRYIKELEEFWTTNYNKPLNFDETVFSYSSEARRNVYGFPTNHFTSAIKFPFGCYLKRYDGAQSMNTFWGEQNVFYFNRLGKWNCLHDVIFVILISCNFYSFHMQDVDSTVMSSE